MFDDPAAEHTERYAGTQPPPAEDQFHDLPPGPALVPSTPTKCVSERHHSESLSRAPMTPSIGNCSRWFPTFRYHR
eukprot:1621097-Amphidinium_carterae.2